MAMINSIRSFDDAFNKWKAQTDIKRVIMEDYGTLSLKDLEEPLTKFHTSLVEIDSVKSEIPSTLLDKVTEQLHDIAGWCKNISNSTQADFFQSRDSFKSEVLQRLDRFDNLRISILPIIQHRLFSGPRDFLKESQENSEKIKELRMNEEKEFEELKKRFKSVYDSVTIGGEMQRFQITAGTFRARAKKWLTWVILSSLMLASWLVIIAFNFCFDLSCYQTETITAYQNTCADCGASLLYYEMAKSILFRILIVSFLAFLVALTVRNYNSNMHNYTVNKHKANSLDAALYLLSKASPQASDFVMNQAAIAIFSHQPTGYSSKDPENIGIPLIDRAPKLS